MRNKVLITVTIANVIVALFYLLAHLIPVIYHSFYRIDNMAEYLHRVTVNGKSYIVSELGGIIEE